jgi:hypothetical protein
MTVTEVVFFKEEDGSVPLLQWLDEQPQKVQDKCIVRIERLEEMGHELRRPEADFLREALYELRASLKGIHYRMLYFFHQKIAVLSHGLIKEKEVPPKEIDRAIERKKRFEKDPEAYTYKEPENGEETE